MIFPEQINDLRTKNVLLSDMFKQKTFLTLFSTAISSLSDLEKPMIFP